MDTIHGYTMTQPFSTQNAGTCMWGYCERDGHEYFIKKFLQPKYPVDTAGFSEETIRRKRQLCETFYSEKNQFYQALAACASGNIMYVRSFFREGTSYYAVSEKADASALKAEAVQALPQEQKLTLLREILFNVAHFHKNRIVHADIKPDNFLLKQTKKGFYTAKIIDFDAGFLEGRTPDDIQGDPVYLAPETFLAMDGEDVKLTTKIDVFSLGLLLHQYWSGEFPSFPGDYQYIFEAVLDGAPITVSHKLPSDLAQMIQKMLSASPEDRPTAQELFEKFGPAVPTVSPACTRPAAAPVQPSSQGAFLYRPTDLD